MSRAFQQYHKFSALILFTSSSCLSTAAQSMDIDNEVVVGFVDCGEPFHIRKNGALHSGLVTDVSSKIVQQAGYSPIFHEIPTKRVTSLLSNGVVDMVCFYHQNWSEDPDSLAWGPALVEYKEVFIHKNTSNSTVTPLDRKGKTIGTHMGYIYSAKTMDLFEQKLANRIELTDTDKLYQMLELNRLDLLIDNEFSFKWRQKESLNPKFQSTGIIDNSYQVTCAVTKQAPEKTKKLINAMNELKNQGAIDDITATYMSIH